MKHPPQRATTVVMLLLLWGKAGCAQLQFFADPEVIHHGLTDTLSLVCLFEKTMMESYEVSMLITRDDNGQVTNIADINAFKDNATAHQDGWIVDGQLTDTNSNLTAMWNKPSSQQAGNYTCQAILFRTYNPGVTTTLKENQIVTHVDPTINDLAEVIGQIKDEIDEIEEKLESSDDEMNRKVKTLESEIDRIRSRGYYG